MPLVSLEKRNRYAPNAITSLQQVYPGCVLFHLFCGTILRLVVEDVIVPMKPSKSVYLIVDGGDVAFSGLFSHKRSHASDMGILPYYHQRLNDTEIIGWNEKNITFWTAQEAFQAGLHPEYPERVSKQHLMKSLRGYIGDNKEELPPIKNPNLEVA